MNITPLDPWIRHKIAASQPVQTRPELEAWQLQKLNETLALVRAKSPFYRQHFAGMPEVLDCLEDLRRFPFTTAEDLRRSPLQFVCVSQGDIHRIVTLQSSGTTGEPKRVYFTEADQQLTVDFFDVGMSTLTEPGDKVLILLPGETPGGVGDLLGLGLLRSNREPVPYGPVRDPHHTLDVIQSRQVDCLVGSPTQVLGLARRWQPGMHKPRNILLSTDYVPAAIVDFLERVWGCRVYNHYGTTEMGLGGGVECAAQRGYHVREADLFFEVVDPRTGEAVPDGQPGEVVFSTLTRQGMPLIRYRMDDISRFIPGGCPCGTRLKTMAKAGGRISGWVAVAGQVLRLPDFDEALFAVPEVLNFSVTVTESALRVDVQMLSDADSSAQQVEQALRTFPLPAILDIQIQCRYTPDEPGSLRKRTIIDQRGQHA